MTSTVVEQLDGNRRDQLRNYRKYVKTAPPEGDMSDEPLPTIKQVVIGDEQFAERVLKKRRQVIDVERSLYIERCGESGMPGSRIKREQLGRRQRTPTVNRACPLCDYPTPHKS